MFERDKSGGLKLALGAKKLEDTLFNDLASSVRSLLRIPGIKTWTSQKQLAAQQQATRSATSPVPGSVAGAGLPGLKTAMRVMTLASLFDQAHSEQIINRSHEYTLSFSMRFCRPILRRVASAEQIWQHRPLQQSGNAMQLADDFVSGAGRRETISYNRED